MRYCDRGKDAAQAQLSHRRGGCFVCLTVPYKTLQGPVED